MDNLVSRIKAELERVSWTSSGAHIKTGDVRKIASQAFRSLGDRSKDHVFSLCEELLEQRSWPMKVIAFDFAYRVRRQYNQADFAVFQRWLEEYVRGWGDCDAFQKNPLWAQRREFWLRRAAAVVLIPSIRRGKYMETDPLQVADLLMQDEHDLVRQGYGWMLKELSAKEPDLVFTYLRKHRAVMPRVAFRCALEKLGEERRRILMQ